MKDQTSLYKVTNIYDDEYMELYNKDRRIITYICNELGISRKKYKKLIKKDPKFRDEIKKQLSII